MSHATMPLDSVIASAVAQAVPPRPLIGRRPYWLSAPHVQTLSAAALAATLTIALPAALIPAGRLAGRTAARGVVRLTPWAEATCSVALLTTDVGRARAIDWSTASALDQTAAGLATASLAAIGPDLSLAASFTPARTRLTELADLILPVHLECQPIRSVILVRQSVHIGDTHPLGELVVAFGLTNPLVVLLPRPVPRPLQTVPPTADPDSAAIGLPGR